MYGAYVVGYFLYFVFSFLRLGFLNLFSTSPPCSSISLSSVESLCLRTLISSFFVFLQLPRWLVQKSHQTLLHLLATLRRKPVGQTLPPPATPQGVLTVEDGCCPFKIVFDEDLYVVFDEDIYVLSMYLCFALSMS